MDDEKLLRHEYNAWKPKIEPPMPPRGLEAARDLGVDDAQLNRIMIASAAVQVLRSSTAEPSPFDVIQLSRYIETGNDPLEEPDHGV